MMIFASSGFLPRVQYNSHMDLTIAILTKNSERTLERTLKSGMFANKIIALDDGSTDKTLEILDQYKVDVYQAKKTDFAQKRNFLLNQVTTDWVFYLDSDEVVTDELQENINQIVKNGNPFSCRIARSNYFLGKKMYVDYVDRLFNKKTLKGWSGKVHESPDLQDPPIVIKGLLLHFTHNSITDMLAKTNQWSEYEASLRMEANHPPVAWWRLIRIGFTFFTHNYFNKKLFKYGREGLFESYFQMVDKLVVYTKLWELQQKNYR